MSKKRSAQIKCNGYNRFLDDCIDEYYIGFDAYEHPMHYHKLGNLGIEKWKEIGIHVPRIYYCIPYEPDNDKAYYYLDNGDETKHWFYIDEIITDLETTYAKFNDIIYCRRFTFKTNLKYIKVPDDYIA